MKITAQQAKDRISEICTAFIFEYNGKCCGIDPFSETDFDMWCGDNYKKAESIDEVMNFPLFDGKSLNQIVPQLDTENIDW